MPANTTELMKVIRNVFLAESWTVIETGMPTAERKLVSLAGLNTGGRTMDMSGVATRWRSFQHFTDSVFYCLVEPVRDLPWLSQPRVDDEWSGLSEWRVYLELPLPNWSFRLALMVFVFPQMATRSTPAQTGMPLLRCGATMRTPLQHRLLFHSSFSLSPLVLTWWLESP